MITISAFADEIAPDLATQMDVCHANGVHCIDVRAIDKINVSEFTLDQARGYKKQMDARGFSVPCIGSPLGKITITDPFAPHLDLLKHVCDVAGALGTNRIRMFSFYGPKGGDIMAHRAEVMDRLARMVEIAQAAGCVLLHENEKAIYGAKPEGVKDIFATIKSPNLLGIFDPANFVEEGIRPFDQGWKQGLAELTQYFHIKDKVATAHTCCPAGEGEGQVAQVLTDALAHGFSGYMALEPHMKAAGQFAGFSGPELFTSAATALKKMLDQLGARYQ